MRPILLVAYIVALVQVALLTPRRSYPWTTGLTFVAVGALMLPVALLPLEALTLTLSECDPVVARACQHLAAFPDPLLEELVRAVAIAAIVLGSRRLSNAGLSDLIYWAVCLAIGAALMEDSVRLAGIGVGGREIIAAAGTFAHLEPSAALSWLVTLLPGGILTQETGPGAHAEYGWFLSAVFPAIGVWLWLRWRTLGAAVATLGLAWSALNHGAWNWFVANRVNVGIAGEVVSGDPLPVRLWWALGAGQGMRWLFVVALIAALYLDERRLASARGVAWGGCWRDELRNGMVAARAGAGRWGFRAASAGRSATAALAGGRPAPLLQASRTLVATVVRPVRPRAPRTLRLLRALQAMGGAMGAMVITMVAATGARDALLDVPYLLIALATAMLAVGFGAGCALSFRRPRDPLGVAVTWLGIGNVVVWLALAAGGAETLFGIHLGGFHWISQVQQFLSDMAMSAHDAVIEFAALYALSMSALAQTLAQLPRAWNEHVSPFLDEYGPWILMGLLALGGLGLAAAAFPATAALGGTIVGGAATGFIAYNVIDKIDTWSKPTEHFLETSAASYATTALELQGASASDVASMRATAQQSFQDLQASTAEATLSTIVSKHVSKLKQAIPTKWMPKGGTPERTVFDQVLEVNDDLGGGLATDAVRDQAESAAREQGSGDTE